MLALPTKARILCLEILSEFANTDHVYSSLRDFGPQVIIGLFLCENFLKDDILACVET